jgi:hypothetical protein
MNLDRIYMNLDIIQNEFRKNLDIIKNEFGHNLDII